MNRLFALSILVIINNLVWAQTTIGSATEMKVKGQMITKNTLTNTSNKVDFIDAYLTLSGTNQTLSTSVALSVGGLTIEGGGTKTTQGDWTITNSFTLTEGIVNQTTGKILYTGTAPLRGNTSAFVNGTLSQRGKGLRFFPLGVGTTYMPMALGNVQDESVEIGVKGFTTGPTLTLPLDVNTIASNRYWQITTSGGTFQGSPVSLYVPGSSIDASQKLVVVEADDANGATAISLGGGLTEDFVTSFSTATKPILTIGISEKVDFRILDLITPFNTDNINDHLKILNIEFTFRNKVTLLDRWGVVVKQWNDFRNYDDQNSPNTDNFDFSKLGPGNYICILEYQLTADSPEEKLTQMITVLKGN